jgi:hypothetical protein
MGWMAPFRCARRDYQPPLAETVRTQRAQAFILPKNLHHSRSAAMDTRPLSSGRFRHLCPVRRGSTYGVGQIFLSLWYTA